MQGRNFYIDRPDGHCEEWQDSPTGRHRRLNSINHPDNTVTYLRGHDHAAAEAAQVAVYNWEIRRRWTEQPWSMIREGVRVWWRIVRNYFTR